MSRFTPDELSEAHRALLSTLRKCEKIDAAKMGKSQQTLLERRIAALKVALKLIEKEQTQVEIGMEATMKNERVYKMTFVSVYPMYVQKAEKKGRTKDEVDTIIVSAKA